jgi:hypothetical protein
MTNAEIIELAGHRQVPAWVMKLVGDAVAKEREECAKIADSWNTNVVWENKMLSINIAKEIRARGQE